MHNQEENEVAVTTVASNKISKERGKTMENGKTSLNIRKIKNQVKGITLIALVVTIIVLLILAGIALNLTIGQNGIFSRAQTAANTWRNAETNEQLAMGELEDWMDDYLNGNGGNQGGGTGGGEYNTGTTVEEAKGQNKPFENDTTITDSCTPANSIRVPAGFKIAEDSALTVEDGVVIEDKDGNQFVWIPAKTEAEGGATINLSSGDTTTIVYQRTAFTGENITTYTETMPSDEEASVNAWGGYYIGRYEAGDKEATDATMMREEYMMNQLMEFAKENGIDLTNSDNLTEEQEQQLNEKASEIENEIHTITIKKSQAPYNNITFANLKSLAEGMDTVQGYTTATTKLVSSYAWDTAINFIQIKNSDYGRNSLEGNHSNSDTFTYTDIAGDEQTGPTGELIPTGQTTAVSNIYDMGGNLWEYTTESYSDEYNSYVCRGGCYLSNYDLSPPGSRIRYDGNAYSVYGFRVTLYCSTES